MDITWNHDRDRTRCRPEVAVQERINDTGVLTKSVWCARHRGHGPGSRFGRVSSTPHGDRATSIWMQYMTAYGALVELGRLQKGEFALIRAASSSVGVAAIQTVKAERAVSIATTRTGAKRGELLALGADHVVVMNEEDLVSRVKDITGGAGARIIFDPIAGPLLGQLAEAAALGAMIVEYGWLSVAETPFPFLPALQKALTIRGYWLAETTMTDPERFAKAKRYVYERVNTGEFKPKVAKTLPFDAVVEAYRYMESNEQIGKIVLTVGGHEPMKFGDGQA